MCSRLLGLRLSSWWRPLDLRSPRKHGRAHTPKPPSLLITTVWVRPHWRRLKGSAGQGPHSWPAIISWCIELNLPHTREPESDHESKELIQRRVCRLHPCCPSNRSYLYRRPMGTPRTSCSVLASIAPVRLR